MRAIARAIWHSKPVRTFAQTLAGMLAASGTGIIDADWIGALSVSGMAGLIAFLMDVGDGQTDHAAAPSTADRRR